MKSAISPTRDEDYPEWYQQVVKCLAEISSVRGCMVIKPWGYAVWELMQQYLDRKIKETGHENAYFPLLIPVSLLEKEAAHVDGFAKECAVVTHHRLEAKGGKLIPAGELEEPFVIRPTSETIIGESFSQWIKSYRDLPLLINQWANVMRWEMRPRLFLRTAEFLWQEGHTAHATAEEALEETLLMLEVYRAFLEEILAIPVIVGEKSPGERFPGAVKTFCLEAMMQDRKSLQAGTSHYLGQNFAKAAEIKFSTKEGALAYAETTSWGMTTRLIGALTMCHGDDNGLRIPPRVAPQQVVIIPFTPKKETKAAVIERCTALKRQLSGLYFHGLPIRVHLDLRDMRGGEKHWEWIKKGVPLRLEIGPKELESGLVVYARRDKVGEKEALSWEALTEALPQLLQEVQDVYWEQALAFRDSHIYTHITTFEALRAFFTPKNREKPEAHGGFVLAKWCGDEKTEQLLEDMKVTIRCLPNKQRGDEGRCVLTGRPATLDAIFAKSY